MKSITTRRVFRKFSGINALCNVLSVRHGIRIGAEKSENPDNPRDNVLIISFEFTDGNEKHFFAARDTLIDSLLLKNLTLEHECNGDGEIGSVIAYRVMTA